MVLLFCKNGSSTIRHAADAEARAGVLTQFNNGKGGIAHIAFEVDDVAAAGKELEERGMGMLETAPVEGTSDIMVNFIRPKYTEGILFELVETVAPIDRNWGKEDKE